LAFGNAQPCCVVFSLSLVGGFDRAEENKNF